MSQIIYRTNELATITKGVVAINHEAKTRLAIRNRSGEPVLVLEDRRDFTDINGVVFDSGWGHSCDMDIKATTKRFEGVRNNIGGNFAYCSVFVVAEVRALADSMGMSWSVKA